MPDTVDPPRRESPTSLRLDERTKEWYAARARELGLTPHALMVQVLCQQMPRSYAA